MTYGHEARAGKSPRLLRVLLPLGLALSLSLAGDQTTYAALASQADIMGIGVAAVGVMLGVNRLVCIPCNPFGGALVDRFGRRRLFIAGLGLGILSSPICSARPNPSRNNGARHSRSKSPAGSTSNRNARRVTVIFASPTSRLSPDLLPKNWVRGYVGISR